MVGADNDVVDALGTNAIAIVAGGNAVGRLGRCQTHLFSALRADTYCTQIIHGTLPESKHVVGLGSLIALINFMPFHRRGGKLTHCASFFKNLEG